ncbi:TPA: Trm112 family protein [Candidatus Geothermarchaeota archaeon]|nr:Trm112 family protein [Candidatus Geothermarchaeota archaeon]HIQ13785.1 Trm112 family protein [Thermoprotei archaeon]
MVKYRLSNYLICPACRKFPLKLNILKIEEYPDRDIRVKPCDEYCSYKDLRRDNIVDPPCNECMKKEIVDGYYVCTECGGWYPIIDSIAIMHIGEYRPKKIIRRFIEKYREDIPIEYIEKEFTS